MSESEAEFDARAGETLARIEQALEAAPVAADIELKPGGILELEFEDGSKMIINRHGAARQIWVASRAGGFHFSWNGEQWRDTRDGSELFAALSRLISLQSRKPVTLGG